MKKFTRNLRVVETEVVFYFENKVHNKTFLFPAPVSEKEIKGLLELIFPGSKLLETFSYGAEDFTISLPLALLLNASVEGVVETVKYRNNEEVSE